MHLLFNISDSTLPRYSLLRDSLLRHCALGAVLLALAGCGNKGPLYLPTSPEPREAASAEPATAVELSATPNHQ